MEVPTAATSISVVGDRDCMAVAGSQISYTITVTNNGPNAATNVVVTDTLPAALSLVSATPTQGGCVGTTTIRCNVGTLANGANASVTLLVNLSAGATDTVTNTASVTATETDPTPANATSSSSINVITGAAPVAAPTLSLWSLIALAMILFALAGTRLRRAPTRPRR